MLKQFCEQSVNILQKQSTLKRPKALVVEHKGNALPSSCFLDLCPCLSATWTAVRFRGRVLRLQCARNRSVFRPRVPKCLWGSLSILGGFSDEYRIEITMRVARGGDG